MWVVGYLTLNSKTIADFLKDNGEAVQAVCENFIELCR
jgi:hypothetical protein